MAGVYRVAPGKQRRRSPLASAGSYSTSLPSGAVGPQNVSGEDLMDFNLMVFVTPDPFMFGSTLIDYPDDTVGLTIDADTGWLIVKLSDNQGQNFYYPALLLGPLEAGEISDVFPVNYFVDGEIDQAGVSYLLPKLLYGFASTPIPEPGTFTLLGMGLAGLAWRRRRRA